MLSKKEQISAIVNLMSDYLHKNGDFERWGVEELFDLGCLTNDEIIEIFRESLNRGTN